MVSTNSQQELARAVEVISRLMTMFIDCIWRLE